jgi:DNA repair and recombination protein RAD54B
MFKTFRTPRRIILSGTPIQNDLGEFHAMVSLGDQNHIWDAHDYGLSKGRFLQSWTTRYAPLFANVPRSSHWPPEEDYPTFRRVYEAPILKSRAPDASGRESEIGRMRSEQVSMAYHIG